MKRRTFIAALGGAAAWPLVALAQQALPKVGYVVFGSPEDYGTDRVGAFRKGLSETGYVDGDNVTIEFRSAQLGEFEHLPPPALWSDPRVLITPHVSGASDEDRHGGIDLFCDNLRAYLEGQLLRNVIDWARGY